MRSFQLRLFLLCISAGFLGCSAGGASRSAGGSSGDSYTGAPSGVSSGTGATSGSSAGPTDTTSQGTGGSVRAGTLTAGTWDDNLNYTFYLPYLQQIENEQVGGLPIIPRAGRLEIQVTDASGAPIGNAKVKVSNAGGQPLLQAPTRPDGKLFFFPGLSDVAVGDALQIQAALGAASATVVASVGDTAVSIPLAGVQAATADALDLAIVIDTTGSMGDELAYLQAEVSAISAQVAQQYPNVTQRLALIVYRDTGDEYVVRSFDFTSSVSAFQSEISAQSAAGGNDYPESPDKALAALPQLTWRSTAVARMAFWIADAPHHDERAAAMVSDFLAAQAAGIRLYPIAASGTNDLLEYTMRTAAEVTGGRYLFLTNDSGVGNDHKEPTIPCYQVTLLDKAMLRMIAMELTGTEIQPAPADVIRSTGDPHDGTCLLDDGQQVCAL